MITNYVDKAVYLVNSQ